jgi:quercetin dioxygenase-like cupin family protein
MSSYTIRALTEVPDIFDGQYPGAMRFLTDHLEAQQVALTHRLMPPKSGGKGSDGHRHKTQEEIYFVISGKLQFKLEDEVIECERGAAVRVAPEVFRSVWNDAPEDAEIVIVSTREEDSKPEYKPDFWPE